MPGEGIEGLVVVVVGIVDGVAELEIGHAPSVGLRLRAPWGPHSWRWQK
jgi:hypothetical protein